MKNILLLLFCIGLCALSTNELLAQQKPQKEDKLQAEEEEGPMLFKFEPDYRSAEEDRRKEILLMRAMIDSLDISESKRQKLIRELYKNNGSRKLNKILLANNKFDE